MSPRAALRRCAILACGLFGVAKIALAQVPTAPPRLTVGADPRIELFSVVRMLADPAEHQRLFGPGDWDYAKAEEMYFAGASTYPVVARLRRWMAQGVPDNAPVLLLLHASDPPSLAAAALPDQTLFLVGGAQEARAFLQEMRDFATRTRFQSFFTASQPEYEAWAAEATLESRGTLTPVQLESYARVSFDKRYLFVLAPFLPRACTASTVLGSGPDSQAVRLFWLEPGLKGKVRFAFNSFGNSAAHELLHTIVTPLASGYERELEQKGVKAPAGCGDYLRGGWRACIDEQVVLAVTLRAVASKDPGEYGRELDYYSTRGYPQLRALCERLREFEADNARYPSLPDFFPRLAQVFSSAFRVSLKGNAPEQIANARQAVASPAQRYNDAGVKAFQQGDPAAAAKDFEAAMAADPGDVQSRMDCGIAYDRLGRDREALGCYDKAVLLAQAAMPLSDGGLLADALSSRAALLEKLGRYEQARADLEHALKVAPQDWPRRSETDTQLAQDKRRGSASPPDGP